MKRLLLLLGMICLLSSHCFASKIKVISGSTEFLKKNGYSTIVFDFSKTTWEKDQDFETWCGNDYEKRIEAMKWAFLGAFNTKTKGLKIDNASTNPIYKIVIEVRDLERHQAFTGAWGQGKFSTTCLIRVIDIQTNENVCEIYVDGYGAGKDYDYADGLGKCFKGLAEEVVKL